MTDTKKAHVNPKWKVVFIQQHFSKMTITLFTIPKNCISGSLVDFRNTNEWVEICEASIAQEGKRFGMGIERLKYLFFSKPFPYQNVKK